MNLLMVAPLCDSRGVVRYHLGAQVDVSGLVKECAEMDSLRRLLDLQARGEDPPEPQKPSPEKNDELRELSEMLNQGELATICKYGGRMHREEAEEDEGSVESQQLHQQPRLLIKDSDVLLPSTGEASGKLSGIYQHVSHADVAFALVLTIGPVPSRSTFSLAPHSLRQPLTATAGDFTIAIHEQDRRVQSCPRRADRCPG